MLEQTEGELLVDDFLVDEVKDTNELMYLKDLEEVVEQPTHAIVIDVFVDLSMIVYERMISRSGLYDALTLILNKQQGVKSNKVLSIMTNGLCLRWRSCDLLQRWT